PNSPVQENKRNEWMYKYLKTKRKYAFSGSSFSLVEKEDYSYTDFVTDTIRCGDAYQRYFDDDDAVVCSNQGVYSYRYDILPGIKKITQINDTLYSQLSTVYLATKKTFIYDPETLLLKSTATQTSKGEQRERKIWYSNDAAQLENWDAGQVALLNTMKVNNRLAIPVKEELAINGALKHSVVNY